MPPPLFTIRDGQPENVDVVAEWRIVDAKWYEIFAKAGVKKVFKILIKLDAQKHEARAVDQAWSVEWRAGIPTLTLQPKLSADRRRKSLSEPLSPLPSKGPFGQVYNYRFASSEIKTPLQDAVTKAGWTWRGIAFGKL